MDALLRGEALPVNGDGTNSRDFTFVETVCEVLLEAAERKVSHPEPVNLAFGTNTNLLELVDEIARVSGSSPRVRHRNPRPGDVKHSQANNESLRSLFPGVTPVTLDVGLEKTYKWFTGEKK